ncbi:MAG: error-prone polymerase, partial [bacterium]
DDLTIQVAIVRPGPIQGGAVNPYIERRQRLRVDPGFEIPYDHRSLEPVLRDTLGTIIFQDQVIEVAMAFAGFSPGEAEGLRRAMSRKRSAAAIEAHHRGFVEGAMGRWPDVDAAMAERVWTMIVGFSGFGFPKAHGAAFGLLAYQSTWLRVHYGPEFLCALLDEQPMGFYAPDSLVHEAQRRGIEVLAPDVNESDVGCTVTRDGAVRLGLGYILGVRADEVAVLVAARRADGPFRSLDDLASRAGAGRPALERLAWSGACDALAEGHAAGARDAGAVADGASPAGESSPSPSARRTALWRLGIAAPAFAAGADATQLALPIDLPQAPALAPVADWDAMIADYATTGLTVHRHPLRLLRDGLRTRGAASSADLATRPHGASVRIAGLVVARQRPGTAKGVVFLLIEDETGTVNLIVPPKVYERDRLTVRTEPLVLVDGTLERHPSAGGAINVVVRRIVALDAPDLLDDRPRAPVKELSPLGERERQRILAEQPLVAVGGGGAVAAPPGGGRRGAIAAVASGDAAAGLGGRGSSGPASAAGDAGFASAAPAGSGSSGLAGPRSPEPREEADDRGVREGGGADDFRAVAPPIMNFAQGRRR